MKKDPNLNKTFLNLNLFYINIYYIIRIFIKLRGVPNWLIRATVIFGDMLYKFEVGEHRSWGVGSELVNTR